MPPRASKLPCPLGCGQHFWGQHWLDAHLKKPHTPCPFCDRQFRKLSLHVRAAHPMQYNEWANES